MSVQTLPDELLDRVQSLSAQVDELADESARELAQDLVSAVIALYGDGLRRIIEVIESSRESDPTRPPILDQLAGDGAVASLLLIHDLYPVGLEERVREALGTVRPYMESHGGNVELVGIEDGVAKLVLEGSCNGCAASRATLELAIKQALDEHAPDLVGLDVEGVSEPPVRASDLIVLEVGAAAQRGANGELATRWVPLDGASELMTGELRVLAAGGSVLLLANVAGALLAYRNACASCGGSLQDGELIASMLRCPHCEVEFDLKRAGRAAGGEPLQLTPIPLLQDGGVRVAV